MPDQHDLPETSSEERGHVLGPDCWCEPTVEKDGDQRRVVTHSRSGRLTPPPIIPEDDA